MDERETTMPLGSVPPRSRLLGDLISELAARQPDSPSVIGDCGTTTFLELDRLSDKAAAALQASGIGRGATVGLLCTNRLEWVATALGAFKAGARLAAFHTWARGWDLAFMLAHSRCELLVTLGGFRSNDYLEGLSSALRPESAPPSSEDVGAVGVPQVRQVVVLDRDPGVVDLGPVDVVGWHDWLEAAGAEAPAPVHRSAVDEAVVIYTSGTTARPKAVPLQHYGMIENTFDIGARMDVRASDRVWIPVPLFWSFGGVNAWGVALTHGAAIVIREVFDPAIALADIAEHQATVAYTMPHITNALLADESFTPEQTASLRTGLTIGPPRDVRRAVTELGIAGLCNVYGSTELYGNCCVTPAAMSLEARLGSQGPPLPGFEVRIVDRDSGTPCPPGTSGEIRVRGYATPGYLTAGGYDRGAFDADGFFRTGDVGFLDELGCLHFEYRDTDMIKLGGINISPAEIEDFLLSHPDVEEAVVVCLQRSDAAELVAVVSGASSLSSEALERYASGQLASFKVPRRFLIREQLPRTSTGKVSRALVREQVETLAAPVAGGEPAGEEG